MGKTEISSKPYLKPSSFLNVCTVQVVVFDAQRRVLVRCFQVHLCVRIQTCEHNLSPETQVCQEANYNHIFSVIIIKQTRGRASRCFISCPNASLCISKYSSTKTGAQAHFKPPHIFATSSARNNCASVTSPSGSHLPPPFTNTCHMTLDQEPHYTC